jgi:aspartate ammonia-lyase
MRTEKDFLGEAVLPDEALYGIHSWRAVQNFPVVASFSTEWYKAMGLVKLACYRTYGRFKQTSAENGLGASLAWIPDQKLDAMEQSAMEISVGEHFNNFIVPALQGGAGTSINLNVNEIISNRSLQLLGLHPGNYHEVDPFEHANVFQSTNDVVPTALKIAVMRLLTGLETAINNLRGQTEQLEKEHRYSLREGYTQMQSAVPTSHGRMFSAFSDALSRDWWRVSKCFERIKEVNLGGGAIGSGLSVPRFFIMEVTRELQELSRLPVTRSENLQDNTSNLDSFVEVHAILKAHAVNLEKMVSDIRLLASDIAGTHQIEIPARQVGSTIMPGKVNPVIPEYVVGVCHKIHANDQLIGSLCAQGCLELNAYIPFIGHALLESLQLLISANQTMQTNLFENMVIRPEKALASLYHSPSIATALTPYVGYHTAANLAVEMKSTGCSVFEANQKLQLVTDVQLQEILKPQNLLSLGYSLKDLEL